MQIVVNMTAFVPLAVSILSVFYFMNKQKFLPNQLNVFKPILVTKMDIFVMVPKFVALGSSQRCLS